MSTRDRNYLPWSSSHPSTFNCRYFPLNLHCQSRVNRMSKVVLKLQNNWNVAILSAMSHVIVQHSGFLSQVRSLNCARTFMKWLHRRICVANLMVRCCCWMLSVALGQQLIIIVRELFLGKSSVRCTAECTAEEEGNDRNFCKKRKVLCSAAACATLIITRRQRGSWIDVALRGT